MLLAKSGLAPVSFPLNVSINRRWLAGRQNDLSDVLVVALEAQLVILLN